METQCKVKQYGIYWCDLPENDQHIQSGRRPVIVISNNKCNAHSPVVTIIPVTTRVKKHLPTHLMMSAELAKKYGLREASTVLAECIISTCKFSFAGFIGYISDKEVQDKIEEKVLERILRF